MEKNEIFKLKIKSPTIISDEDIELGFQEKTTKESIWEEADAQILIENLATLLDAGYEVNISVIAKE